jgi:hypothetical protein
MDAVVDQFEKNCLAWEGRLHLVIPFKSMNPTQLIFVFDEAKQKKTFE